MALFVFHIIPARRATIEHMFWTRIFKINIVLMEKSRIHSSTDWYYTCCDFILVLVVCIYREKFAQLKI